MALNRTQYITLVVAILAFLVLYFGCDTRSADIQKASESRVLNMESTSIQNILIEARKSLSPDEMAIIQALNVELDKATSDSTKINIYQRLASSWYQYSQPVASGHYAELIAQLDESEDNWSIAGTTYLLGTRSTESEKIRDYAASRAIKAFDNALSMNPDNINHKINKALVYVDNPVESPMEGIMMLRELNTQYPENVAVINQLARLAIRTNQYDRAIERLLNAVSIEPKNSISNCLLAEAYEAKGDIASAKKYAVNCI